MNGGSSCRMAEVFAGYISYADHQIGRVLDYLEESGQLDNTSWSWSPTTARVARAVPTEPSTRWRFFNGVPTRPSSPAPHR